MSHFLLLKVFEQRCLSDEDHNRSTSVRVSVRGSCLTGVTPVALGSVPGKSKGEKCKKWQTKKGKPGECTDRQKTQTCTAAPHSVTELLRYALYVGSFRTHAMVFPKTLDVEAKLDTKQLKHSSVPVR